MKARAVLGAVVITPVYCFIKLVFSNLEMRLKPSLFKKNKKTVRNNVEQAMARFCLNKKVYRAVPFFYIFTSIFPLSLSPLKFVD